MKLRSAPLSFNYTGYYAYSNGAMYDATSEGNYWSCTASTAEKAAVRVFDSRHIYPAATNNRGYGNALRCVAR